MPLAIEFLPCASAHNYLLHLSMVDLRLRLYNIQSGPPITEMRLYGTNAASPASKHGMIYEQACDYG